MTETETVTPRTITWEWTPTEVSIMRLALANLSGKDADESKAIHRLAAKIEGRWSAWVRQ